MLWERIYIGSQERILVAKNQRLKAILTPGTYRLFTPPLVSVELERHDVRNLVLQSKWAGYLLDQLPALVERHFICVRTNEVQVAMVYANGQLFKVLTPFSRILIWRDVAEISAELVDVVGDSASEDSDLMWEDALDLTRTFH